LANTAANGVDVDVLARQRSVHRMLSVVQGAAALALVAGYLLYIHRYGVNLPFWDEWTLGRYVLRLADGQLTLADLLIAKHNEHLVGASFGLMLMFHALSGYDSKAILYASAALQFASVALLLVLARPLLPAGSRRGWQALLLAAIMLSLAPSWNILWGFQTAWYLITFFLFACLWLLDRSRRESGGQAIAWLAVAALSAALASFSSIHGLAVWVAGAVFLFVGHPGGWRDALRSSPMRSWLVAFAAFMVLFGWVFTLTPTTHSTSSDLISAVTAGPGALAAFALGILSTAWGDHLGRLMFIAGGLVAALCVAAIVAAIRSADRSRFAFPLAVMAFALIFVMMVALGRFRFGSAAALEARYSLYVLLAVAAAYLMLISASEATRMQRRVAVWRALLAALMLALFVSSTAISLKTARGWRLDRGIGAMVLLNFDREPDLKIARSIHFDHELVRQQAARLRAHSLSTFADGASAIPPQAALYAKPPQSLIELWQRRPEDGAALQRLWEVYVVGGDLRQAFPMYGPRFPADLIGWAARSARGRHYLAPYLAQFAERYESMRDDLAASAATAPR
jgi:hypothetical protein